MSHIIFNDEQIELSDGQTVLSALLDQGHAIPNSCRAGACQSCLMQAIDGDVPETAQLGLKDTQKSQGYFLACSCIPETSLKIITSDNENLRINVNVIEHKLFNEDILCLRLKPKEDFDYNAGQFITLWKNDKVGRSYSLASVARHDDYLELHIRRIPDGSVSNWLHDEIKPGDNLQIQAATGDCFYSPGSPEQKILLAGTGTGLAPLIGIARDAIQQGHSGDIHLIHGTVRIADLYMHQTLLDMQKQHSQFNYHTSVLQAEDEPMPVSSISLDQQLIDIGTELAECKIYLCGDPDMVNTLKRKLFIAGATMKHIYTDPFVAACE